MWLVIDKATQRVFAIETVRPPDGAYKAEFFDLKEWDGAVPRLATWDAETGGEIPGDIDPTLADPAYLAFLQGRIDLEALAGKATAEIEWLNEIIPNIPTMTGAEVRDVVHRIAREQREELKAWRYIFRRLA